MKYFLAAFLLVGSAAFAQDAVPEIAFDSVPNFLKLPADLYLGEVAGVAVNSKGHVFVFFEGQYDRSRVRSDRRTVAGVRPGRAIHPRDREESVCVVVRARGAGG